MNIGNIRTYLENAVNVVDSNLSLLEDSFDDKEISRNEAERGYKITFGINALEKSSNSYIDSLPVTIAIYSPRKRDEVSAHDVIYTKAYDIRNQVIDPKCIETQNDFTDIDNLTITPSLLDTGDKTIKMEIEFIIRNDFLFC